MPSLTPSSVRGIVVTVLVLFRDNMQGGMRLLDHLRAGVRPRVPGAVPWREKYHAAQ